MGVFVILMSLSFILISNAEFPHSIDTFGKSMELDYFPGLDKWRKGLFPE